MKSYFNWWCSRFNKEILPIIGKKQMLKEMSDWYKEGYWPYYKENYRDDYLAKFIIYEYIYIYIY